MTIQEHLEEIEHHVSCVRQLLVSGITDDVKAKIEEKLKAHNKATRVAAATEKLVNIPTNTDVIDSEYERQVAEHIVNVPASGKPAQPKGAY